MMGLMTLDPVSSLILDEAGPLIGRVLVLDDVGGALTRVAADAGAEVRTWCDDVRDLADVPAQFRVHGVLPDDWTPELVLWRLPTALSALEDYAEYLAGRLPADGRVVGGARTRHMTPNQNVVLGRQFSDVSASLGRQKSRVLHASGPTPQPRRWPSRRYLPEVGLTVIAHGAVFNTNRLDDGTRLLLRTMSRSAGEAPVGVRAQPRGTAIDLGSGSGIIATWLAQRGWTTTAVDVALSAIASTRMTARANDVRLEARRADGLTGVEPGTVDLIASNPPFHRGAAKDSTPTLSMIGEVGRALRPGGEFWTVFNSHLPYLPELRAQIGITTVEAQDRHFIVTRSMKESDR